jgi:hypothetical protein
MNILFSKDHNRLFAAQQAIHKEEITTWYVFNVVIPIIIILIPTVLFSFLPDNRLSFQNLILNGSFSLLGINILFGMSTFLINSIRLKDQKFEAQIIQVRKRLIIYLCGLLILSSIIYILQIAFNLDELGKYITTSVGCFLMLYLSIVIGKRVYLLKDELVGKSYNEDVTDSVNDLKSSLDDLE